MKAFPRFLIYLLSKWLIFYTYQFADSNVRWNFENVNIEGLILTAFVLLAWPFFELLILYLPVQWALTQKGLVMAGTLVLLLAVEFAIGWFQTSQHFEPWMAIKIALSATVFFIIYLQIITPKTSSLS